MIACLGWGSLIWDPRELRLRDPDCAWHRDGPEIPLEFGRQSRDGRITLVVTDSGRRLPTLWAYLDCTSIEAARGNLTEREWPNGDPAAVVDVWTKNGGDDAPHESCVRDWGLKKGFDGVVWTKLPPKFDGVDGRMPSCSEVVNYLRSLSGSQARLAEDYVRRTPLQVATPYRRTIESSLGWTYEDSLTDNRIVDA
jgi:hypothetical protein